jgi:transposase-like protein
VFALTEAGKSSVSPVGDSEDGVFWAEFFRSLRSRGLTGVKLVISDHHLGLKKAISEVFVGAAWQRCRVHYVDDRIMWTSRPEHRVVAGRGLSPAEEVHIIRAF